MKNVKPPKGFARLVWRAPIWLYKLGLGGLLKNRFMLLNHTGRKSGRKSGLPRQNVLEIIRYDEQNDLFYVASGFGEKAAWFRNITANPRRVIGGHIIGLFSGSLCALIPHSSILPSIVIYSLAVGISIFLMVALDMEHPPASGTALGIAITGFSPSVMLAVLTSSIVLSLSHRFSKRFLRDLT